MKTGYFAENGVRNCGHTHHTIEAAKRCQKKGMWISHIYEKSEIREITQKVA